MKVLTAEEKRVILGKGTEAPFCGKHVDNKMKLNRDGIQLTKFQKLMLLNADPVKQAFNYFGGAIAVYFLWLHDWKNALLFGLGIAILGSLLASFVFHYKAESIANSFAGKVFLRFSTPVGFALYLMSHILVPYAFWSHNLYLGIFGLMLFLIGCFVCPKSKY